MSTTSPPPPTPSSNSTRRPNEPSFPWLGAALTAATVTAALVVPGVLYLRRKKLPIHSAPRRRIASNMSLRSLPAVKAENNAFPVRDIQKPLSAEETATAKDQFSPALYSVRALAVATLLVSVGAGATFWAVKTAMEVKDVHDFAQKMRQIILARMPILSSRIHRMVEGENDDSIMDPSDWKWEDAERRMKDAYDNEGILAWGEVAIKELQAEERAGRLKRKQLEDVAQRKA